MVVIDQGEAIVFDTPVHDSISEQLIYWITEVKQADIKAVVVNHFHIDCLGGIEAFQKRGVGVYASQKTIALATADSVPIPDLSFAKTLTLKAGEIETITQFLGEGHTIDNVVSYVPAERSMFGGCMIKALEAKRGNLADANLLTWSRTVERVKSTYPNVEYVIPGHGAVGDTALLNYTIDLFEP